jgi:hypothetical protein
MAWHRNGLTALARSHRARAQSCATVPLWLLLFAACSVSYYLRADPYGGAGARRFLFARVGAAGGGVEPSGAVFRGGAEDALSWVAGVWGGALGDGGARGAVVGGLRLSQWRAAGGCGGAPPFAAALLPGGGADAPCAFTSTGGVFSGEPFGAAAARAGPWGAAFAPAPPPLRAALAGAGDAAGPARGALAVAFSTVVRLDGSGAGAAAGAALAGAGWADGATVALEGGALAVLPALGRWVAASVRLEAGEGGAFSGAARTCAVRLAPPGGGAAGLWAACDAAVVAGAALLCLGAARRLLRAAGGGGKGLRAAGGALFVDGAAWWALLGVGVEMGVGIALSAAAAAGAAAGGAGERLATAGAAAANARAAGGALSPWAADGGGLLLLHAAADAACEAQAAWLGAAAGAGALLAARALQLLALSPRVALLGAAFGRAVGDAAHLGATFCALFFAFALVGHGAFGGASERFATPRSAAFALLQMMVFDYDFDAMAGAGLDLAVAFFALFMMLVTHALLWAGLGIVLETFAMVRGEAAGGARGAPSLLADARAGAAGARAWAAAACARWGPCRRHNPPGAPPLPPAPWVARERRLQALDRLLWALAQEPAGGKGGGGGGGAAAAPAPPAAVAPPTPQTASASTGAGAAAYVTCAELAAALGVSVAAARRAAAAVVHGDDTCAEYEKALAALLADGSDGGGAGAAAEESGGWGGLDAAPAEEPAQQQKTIAVRGVLIRTAAPPPLELSAVSP